MRIMILFLVGLLLGGCQNSTKRINPPRAEKIKKELKIHGHTRIDNYYWLKERTNPEVIAYLEAENEYTDSILKHTELLQEQLYEEIVGRIKQTDESVPYFKNGYYYYTRYESGKEYPVYCRKKSSLDAQEEVMLNVNECAEGYDYYHVRGLNVSPDNRYLAFGVDTLSRRKYTIHIKDLSKNSILEDDIQNTTASAVWANDNKTIYYTRKDDAMRPFKIFMHKIGDTTAEDKEIFHENDATFVVNVWKSKSDRYIFITSISTLSTESRFLQTDKPGDDFMLIIPREQDHEYYVEHYGNNFYIKTNFQAKNFKLVKTPVSEPGKENWIDVVPHRDDVLLEKIEVFKEFLVLQERKDGLTQLRIRSWGESDDYYLEFDEPAYTAYIGINPEFDTPQLRYKYTSLTTPTSTFDYNMKNKSKTLLKQVEVVGDFNPADYTTERLYAVADDGIKIPISLVYRSALKDHDSNPLLLTGYGSYGSSNNPRFNSARLSLIDRGFIFAIAHIRGGEEMGREWYEEGKLLKKRNTFTDFIACAEHLINNEYTRPDQLCAIGGSAGGLLIGAVVNMRPELFKAVIAAVPFVDVITTMLDPDIPLTTMEYDEWGDPNKKEYYNYILTYSPYDNVSAQDYPAMLVTTGLHDSQVQYWEPAKWVAKLREYKMDQNVLLLKTDMESGHSGAAGRFERHRMTALEYAFLLDQVGIK
jgi:oligopeptidase B